MIVEHRGFFFTGGNLERDAPSYVERAADQELYDALRRGEFCYVLDSRQMGKSSLMVRTAARLRRGGATVLFVDLTALGQGASIEQWYDGLLYRVSRQLELEDELDDFWRERERLGPLQRWMAALREVVLEQVPGQVVIFIDEIDAVRSLSFATDEFFAAIRECYTRRSEDPAFDRLTFCLLGVARPADLIRDTRTTPFNIGRRIQLHDFTEADAAPLARGLLTFPAGLTPPPNPLPGAERGSRGPRAAVWTEAGPPAPRHPSPFRGGDGGGVNGGRRGQAILLQRVLYWTGGHPYLTQKLCQAVANALAGGATTEDQRPARAERPEQLVDRLCDELYLSRGPKDRDHLQLVPLRLLHGDEERAGLLDLYARIRRRTDWEDDPRPWVWLLRRLGLMPLYERIRHGPPVRDDDTSALVATLRLSGMIRVVDGALRVRNRIYQRVFDAPWVRDHMPDAELRRQRAAYRRGLLRAATLAGSITLVTTGLAVTAFRQARRADRLARGEARQRHVAEEGQEMLRRHLYAAQMNLAQQAWESGNVAMARELLERYRPLPGQEDLRGFEWRYLWRLCEADARVTLHRDKSGFMGVVFSPDGKLLASGNGMTALSVWDLRTRREMARLPGHRDLVSTVAFSADGKTLASGSLDGTARLWDLTSGQPLATFRGFRQGNDPTVFSSQRRLLAACRGSDVTLWDVDGHREVARLRGRGNLIHALALSPDGRLLATTGGEFDRFVMLWDLAAQRMLGSLKRHQAGIGVLAFSPDGRTLASGSDDSTVKLWDVVRKQEIGTLTGHRSCVNDVAFSPDGRLLASASDDLTVRLWNTVTKREVRILRGHGDRVWGVRFSPDGSTLASASQDGTVKLWDVAEREPDLLQGHTHGVWEVAFSPDGKVLASASADNEVRLWEVASRRSLGTLHVPGGVRHWMALSPDGRTLATGSADRTMKLWDVASWRQVASLAGHTKGIAPTPAFSPDGKTLASGNGDGTIKLWDVAARREVARLKGHRYMISALAYSPDGRLLASGAYDSLVKLWDPSRQRQVATLSVYHHEWITDVTFSPDGRLLATASMGPAVRLWDLTARDPAADPTELASSASGEPGQARRWPRQVATLQGNAGIVDAVEFSRDGRTLVTSGAGRIVQLWNVATRELVATLAGHQAQVWGLAFSPDGNTLATSSMDTTVRLWHAASFAETDARRDTRKSGSAR
jgi:WD40 repeat protein